MAKVTASAFVNPYQALALESDATPEQIKSAYRTLAKQYHPDSASNQGHTAVIGMFQQVTEAYQLLSDPEKRRKYDAIRKLLDAKTADPFDDSGVITPFGNYRSPFSSGRSPMSGSSFSTHGFGGSAMFFAAARA